MSSPFTENPSLTQSRRRVVLTVVMIGMALAVMAGCGFSASSNAIQAPVALHGTIRGGQKPISGAQVQLYSAGTTGRGSAAIPLLDGSIESDQEGNFVIPASYLCPSASSQLYLIARGGNPGLSSASENSAIALTTMLGSCGSLSASSPVLVNEVTTVGSVWPVAPYMKSPTELGSAAGDAVFLSAVSSVHQFIDIFQGSSPGISTPESYFTENAKLYSLADALDKCVNSAGGSAGDGSTCGVLFSMATPQNGSAPTDTMSAAIRIAQNPYNEVSGIYGLIKAPTAFQPTLTAVPPDWTLVLSQLVATPTISLATGSYVGSQTVTISDATSGTSTYYTTDGTTPSVSSAVYSGPISISASATVQAIAVIGISQSAVASSTLTITPGVVVQVPVKLAFSQQPSNALVGEAISPAVQVVIQDASGNPVLAAKNLVRVNLAGVYGLGGTLEIAAKNGVATFNNLTVTTAGSYTLATSSPGLASAVSTQFTVTAPPVTGPAARLAFLQQPSNTVAGNTMAPPVQVALENANGVVVTSANNPVTLALQGGTGLTGTLTLAPVNGIATFSNLAISTAGTGYSLSASSTGLTGVSSANFTISTAGSSAGVAAKLAFVQQPTSGTAQVAISPAVKVAVEDANGNTVANASNVMSLALTSGSGLGGTLTAAARNGIATFSDLDLSSPGTGYTLVASSPSLASATSTTFTISEPNLSNVQSLGVIPSSQPLAGLGFNLNPLNEWEFQLAATAGTTHVRFQCGWITTETQTAPPQNTDTATPYVLQPDCQTGLSLAKKYGMHPTIVAAFGSPYHATLSVAVPGGAPAGATIINTQFASGTAGDTMASLAPYYDTMIATNGSQISGRHSYAGDLVTGVHLSDSTHATLTLASGLTAALPASATTLYTINEYLHPPPATFSPSDPSVVAYAKYAQFLAQNIAAAGLTGDVELWNEPPWSDDPWDSRADFYDSFPGFMSPGPHTQGMPNWGFVAALQSLPSIPGVTYTWAGPNKTGDNSVLNPNMLANTGVAFAQPATNVTSESLHPYTNNPEDSVWSEACLRATIKPFPAPPSYGQACNVVSTSTSNALEVEQQSLVQKSQNSLWGVGHAITETGFQLSRGDTAHQARYTTRIFLGFQADGVTPVEFYRLYDNGSEELGFTDPTTESPLPAFTAIAGLMSDLGAIKNAAVAEVANMASIVNYNGTYPLDTVHIVGARPGDTVASDFFVMWQQSSVVPTGQWGTLAQPNAAPVTVAIPPGFVVSSVLNLDTRQTLSYTNSGKQITVAVSDDPVEILLVPTP